MSSDMETHKRTAARRAADMVKSGMVVGLGTGSTATYMIERLGERVAEGLHIVGIPTSEDSARKAEKAGIPLTDFAAHRRIDIAIDGADEVQRGSLNLIKGLGGALLREKIVAQAAKKFVVIVDGSKPVDHLGERAPVPVEVISFGWECTAERLSACGAKGVKPRTDRDGNLFVSDNRNMILDCTFGPIEDPEELARQIDAIVGVVEHGMFLNMASEVLVATEQGVERWEP
ncbi:ribose 5-phosphate isomerase A [Gluconobacter thailandicus F149-1 = NBRC 100600]|uniref:Ribose-5-phosphate isomerase A n=2 Tax=Gluconobacter thailandicus TaxID=257438 RepID=A0AAJ0QML2_GLUTH|nr:ribose-5-phosphate isomerase RpiA [Gluconobacter thailandicus]ANQ41250.1 ribose 5-phosphate isomerase A [Gluconobacter oxydans]KXV32583.1 ribose 5-phosphate isomerase [Gluconobacter thailandicus]KXV51883.1 ribose 5-phosphate isomerase [Gluconobacter thailandicus]QEH96390.1 ribose-5-phosphate isomerase RpiA [Gluconobacter thailandicus]GAN93420.1 ribose 5-phosphate isomerase A [Gluconobacter thailandicus F149-1 = NBRC 100600]